MYERIKKKKDYRKKKREDEEEDSVMDENENWKNLEEGEKMGFA